MSLFSPIRHINTIELQLEVTRFLQRCEAAAASAKSPQAAALKSPGSGSPPTLFGGSAMKVEIACRVKNYLATSSFADFAHLDRKKCCVIISGFS